MEKEHAGRLYWVLRFASRILTTLYFRHRATGVEWIPREGGFILAANHASYLDPVLLGVKVSRPLHYMARHSLFRGRVAGWLLRALNGIPVRRAGISKESMKACRDVLERGGGLVVFPEGTRSADGHVAEFRSGVVHLAMEAGVPLVPAYVRGSHRALGRGKWLPKPVGTSVHFGKPLRLAVGTPTKEGIRLLREQVLALAQVRESGRELLPVG